jgi:two-component system response regulator AtoC
VNLPPLRERRQEVQRLIELFARRFAARYGRPDWRPSDRLLRAFERYSFPGNVRELENIVQRGLVLSRGAQITTSDLPSSVLGSDAERAEKGALGDSLPAQVAALERRAIAEALQAHDGNQTRAAEALGISERALRYKLKKYRPEDPDD